MPARLPLRLAFFAAAALLALAGAGAAQDSRPALVEPPFEQDAVTAGKLPAVAERIPAEPDVLAFGPQCPQGGRYGGTLRLLVAGAKDTRLMSVYGYARLVGYDKDYRFVPDLAKSFEVSEGRIFTFHLRPGHRWSDGEPFTADDFRYFWQDMATNPDMAKFGVPPELLADGEPPTVTFPDALTIRYEWKVPNPKFLPALAAAQPTEIFRPAHYLKKYHAKYADPAKLAAMVEKKKQRNWAALHFKMDRGYRNDNPDMPTLQPWRLVTEPPADRYVFERNPFFHRVDAAGHQLPYIDKVTLTVANGDLIPAKAANGEADLQAAYLTLANYPFLKGAEARSGFHVRQWESGKGSHVALYPNFNAADPVWRKLIRDVDFRRALSLGINRDDINKAIFYGLGVPGGDTVLPGSPLFKPEYRERSAGYDPDAANRLLDGLGLTGRDEAGLRLLPDGRPMRIVVEAAGELQDQSDVLELVRDDWRRLGIDLLTRESQREVFRNRVKAGSTLMSVWTGLDNGLAVPSYSPDELAPANVEQLQWPAWGLFAETAGKGGEPVPDDPALAPIRRLVALRGAWTRTTDEAEQRAIWSEMLDIVSDEVTTIGIVSEVGQIVVVNDKLENVPQHGVYNFDPGALFGIYHPDSFSFGCAEGKTASLP